MLSRASLAVSSAAGALTACCRGPSARHKASSSGAAASTDPAAISLTAVAASGADRRPSAAAAAPAAGGSAAGVTIGDLPDDMLGLIFTTLDGISGQWRSCAVAAVCKRWFRVFYSAHCINLWRHCAWQIPWHVLEDETKMAACLRVIQRTAGLAEWAEFNAEAEPRLQQAAAQQLPTFLASLDPAMLEGLSIDAMPLLPAALQAVPLFRQLRMLGLCSDLPDSSTAELPAVVDQLGALEKFRFRNSSVGSTLVAALCRLPQLEFLELHSIESPLPPLDALAALAGGLTRLALVEQHSGNSGLQLPQVAAFPNLHRLFVAAPVLQVPGSGRLTAVVSAGNWELEQSERAEFELYDSACWLLPVPTIRMCGGPDGILVDVRNTCLDAPAGVLPALLAALVPAGELPKGLWLRWCGLVPSTFEGCAALLAAVAMVAAIYSGSMAGGQSLRPALGTLLHQTPLLTNLVILCNGGYLEASMPDGAPTAISSLHHLTWLELDGVSLPHLDGVLEGLPDLARLNLHSNRLQRLPDALSRCTKLTNLLLGSNDSLTAHGLDEEAVRLLASLPLLVKLQLPRMSGWRRRKRAAAARARLAAAAPHIQEVTFYEG